MNDCLLRPNFPFLGFETYTLRPFEFLRPYEYPSEPGERTRAPCVFYTMVISINTKKGRSFENNLLKYHSKAWKLKMSNHAVDIHSFEVVTRACFPSHVPDSVV